MTVFDPQALVARILADATSNRLDDAAFRQRAARTARRLQRGIDRQSIDQAAARKRSAAASAARYKFIAVPSPGGSASVSIVRSEFDRFVKMLGSPQAVADLARKVAPAYRPESGMSRSAYVRKRLRRHVVGRTSLVESA